VVVFIKLRMVWLAIAAMAALIGCRRGKEADPESSHSDLPVVESSASAATVKPLTPTSAPEQVSYAEYQLSLDVNPKERKILGVEKVLYINSTGETLNEMRFNVYLNAFSKDSKQSPVLEEAAKKVYRFGEDYGYMKIGAVAANGEEASFEVDDTELKVLLPKGLEPEEPIEIRFEMEAYVPVINARTGGSPGQIWCGNFIPTLAVYDKDGWHTDPCYAVGDPFYTRTSNFSVSVTAPLEYTVVGTGTSKVAEHVEKKTTTFTAKLVRDFAFALSSDYSESSMATSTGVDIELYTYSPPRNAQEILEMAAKSLAYFGELAGPYPYPQLVLVEAGLPYYNSMEYPEIIFLDSDFLNETDEYSAIAHEVGHQWFYNIIGNNQIENAWMDEGLVLFLQEGMLKTWEEIGETARREHDELSERIGEISAPALSSGLYGYKTWSDYYSIQYIRGKLMFYSLRKRIGEDAFNRFIKEYYQRHSFKLAAPQDLIDAVSAVCEEDLTEFFHSWIDGRELPPLE
jgi:hypothetical protein